MSSIRQHINRVACYSVSIGNFFLSTAMRMNVDITSVVIAPSGGDPSMVTFPFAALLS